MKQYPFIASRIFGTPLLIHPGKLEIILQALGPRFGLDLPAPQSAEYDNAERRRAGYRVDRGVAIIPVHGTLVGRADSLDALSGITGYNRISRALDMALSDDDVREILVDYDTPGGEAALLDALAERMFAARQQKRITAMVNELAASAGYWLASSANQVVMTRAATAGSIGVVMTHMSVAGMAEKMGVVITHIHAGAHKVDFSPYQSLSDDAKGDAQARVNELYDLFTGTVARNRGISQATVKSTEARMFSADVARELGLVDDIDSFDATLARLQQAARPSIPVTSEVTTMSQTENNPVNLNAAEVQTALHTARTEARAEERARIFGILGCDEAQGRFEMALALAENEAMTAEAAAKVLAKAPAATTPQTQPLTPFEAAMNQIGNPDVAADGNNPPPDSQAAIDQSWDVAFKRTSH